MENRPTTIVRAAHDDQPYFLMNRATAQDESLSFAARGMLAYLLSKPDHWQVKVTDLQQNCGRDKVYSLIDELIEARYMDRQIERDPKGRMVNVQYVVYECPLPEKPDTAEPDTANTDIRYYRELDNTEYSGDPLGEEIDSSSSTPQAFTAKEKKAAKRLSGTPLPDTYGDLFVAVRSRIYHAAANAPGQINKRSGEDAKLLLDSYPDITADELNDFANEWTKRKPGADEPRGDKLLGWIHTYRQSWKRQSPPDEEVTYRPIEHDDWYADSEAL